VAPTHLYAPLTDCKVVAAALAGAADMFPGVYWRVCESQYVVVGWMVGWASCSSVSL
jgi:hypothetical protein